MLLPFRTTFTHISNAWYLFHSPLDNELSLGRKIANIVFHILTLGIPFLFYHVISYCLTKCKRRLIDYTVSDVRQDTLDFIRQELSKYNDINNFDWNRKRLYFEAGSVSNVPKNADISKLADLYWKEYAKAFEKAFKDAIQEGQNPWDSENVLSKAEDWFKIGCGIMLLTLDDIQEYINEGNNSQTIKAAENLANPQDSEKCKEKFNPKSIKVEVVYRNHWYANQALCYFWHVYTLLRIGADWNNSSRNWDVPQDVNLKELNIKTNIAGIRYINMKGVPKLFYQEGTRQAKWREWYNHCCILLHQFLGEEGLDQQFAALDNNEKCYKAFVEYIA